MLHQVRWRKSPHDRWQLRIALAIALLLHGLFGAFVGYEMRDTAAPQSVVHVQLDTALAIRFVSRTPVTQNIVPPPPLPVAPPRPAPPIPPHVTHEPARKDAMTVVVPAPATTQARPTLFDTSGRIILPPGATFTAPAAAPDYVEHAPQGDQQVMRDQDPVKYKATRLDPYWRKNTNAVDDALQKAVDKTTVKKTVQLPGGIRIHCGISLAMLAGGCGGEPPPPPPSNDGDERMNMAPAAPLAKNPHPPAPPALADCIAAYRAQGPLPYGCPVDTPARAVDAERQQNAAKPVMH